MKYTAEEVRAMAKMVGDEFSPHAGSMLTAYAERIKADEGANDRIDFKGMWNAMSDRAYAHPPAQAAQVDPTAKPRTLADFVNAPDAERVQIGQQVAARVDEMMAEPAAQGDDADGWCDCCAMHTIDEIDSGQCDYCGKPISPEEYP